MENIGFIGAGKMATALAKGLLQKDIIDAERLIASDPLEDARMAFADQTGGRVTESNIEVMTQSSVVVLAVKPHQMASVLDQIKDHVGTERLVISIAAGVRISTIEADLAAGARIIRVMPNTPALVGASATAFSLGAAATREDEATTQRLFSSVGLACRTPEPMLDAVTGLSGCGPAYAYMIIEALSDGGVAEGLPRKMAIQFAAQTLLGAAKMVLETGSHPAELKDAVTSPGGTTIEGVHQLEIGRLRGVLINAVRAGAEKTRRLSAP